MGAGVPACCRNLLGDCSWACGSRTGDGWRSTDVPEVVEGVLDVAAGEEDSRAAEVVGGAVAVWEGVPDVWAGVPARCKACSGTANGACGSRAGLAQGMRRILPEVLEGVLDMDAADDDWGAGDAELKGADEEEIGASDGEVGSTEGLTAGPVQTASFSQLDP